MPLRCFRQPVKAVVSYPAKVVDTEYQNTRGRPILVIASILARKDTDTDDAYCTGYVGSVSGSLDSVVFAGFTSLIGSAVKVAGYFDLVFAVPNNYYYSIVKTISGTGVLVIIKWTEVEL